MEKARANTHNAGNVHLVLIHPRPCIAGPPPHNNKNNDCFDNGLEFKVNEFVKFINIEKLFELKIFKFAKQ